MLIKIHLSIYNKKVQVYFCFHLYQSIHTNISLLLQLSNQGQAQMSLYFLHYQKYSSKLQVLNNYLLFSMLLNLLVCFFIILDSYSSPICRDYQNKINNQLLHSLWFVLVNSLILDLI